MTNDTINVDRMPLTRILVVDDEPSLTTYVSEFLSMVPYDVVVANSGLAALELIKTQPVDIVLLDVMMPEMDGFEVARQMKEYFGQNDFVPIILLSAMSSQQDKVTGLTWADDFITKPFDVNELLARIRAMLRIRQLQQDLIVSKSNYQFLYENAPHLYLTIDEHLKITNCNKMFCTHCASLRENVINKNLLTFFANEDHAAIDEFLQSLDKNIKQDIHPTFILKQNSIAEPMYVSLSAVCTNASMASKSILVAMQDVSRSVRLEKDQKLARVQLYRSARLASIGTFASGVAHELNNPLTAILGFSSALLERFMGNESIDKEDVKQYLSIINTETMRCRDIVENLSRFAREGDVQIKAFSLGECVGCAVRLVHPRAMKKQITIRNTVDKAMYVQADIQKLQQAIAHILTNAIDFCGEGNTVWLSATAEVSFVKMVISDNGPGIDSELLPKIFDPFFTTKMVGQGMGLGLAMSHVIMEECNGNIDVSSESGKGTIVTLAIPRAPMENTR